MPAWSITVSRALLIYRRFLLQHWLRTLTAPVLTVRRGWVNRESFLWRPRSETRFSMPLTYAFAIYHLHRSGCGEPYVIPGVRGVNNTIQKMLGQRNGVVHGGRLMRVAFFSVLLAVIGTGVLAHAEPLRVGIPGLSAEFAPVWAASDRGFFKKYGFESEIIAMQGGTQLAQAVIGGSIPIAVMGGAYLSAAVRGADLVMIATHMDKLPYTLIVKPNLKRVEDLKGSRL